MRRFTAVFVATVAGLVVLLSFKTASTKADRPLALSGATPPASPTPSASSVPSASVPSASVPSASASATSVPPATKTTAKTVTGASFAAEEGRERFGTVAVQLTISNGKITAVTAVDYPQNDPRSSEISSFAIPALDSEALAAQGAQIDAVSGATITSGAYARSLQSALDKAKA